MGLHHNIEIRKYGNTSYDGNSFSCISYFIPKFAVAQFMRSESEKNSGQQDLSCKTSRIKRANCDIDKVVTNVRKIKTFLRKKVLELSVIS